MAKFLINHRMLISVKLEGVNYYFLAKHLNIVIGINIGQIIVEFDIYILG